MTLRKEALDGAFWNVGMAVANKGIKAFGQVMLAWLLLPKDIGIANFALAIFAFTVILSIGGIGDVLLQRGKVEDEGGKALWLSLITHIGISIFLLALSLVCNRFGKGDLRGLLIFLGVGVIFLFPGSILSAALKNKLNFKGIALSQVFSNLANVLFAILLAALKWHSYAIVCASLISQMTLLVSFFLMGARVSIRFPDMRFIKEIIKPTISLTFSTFLSSLQFQIPVLICGLYLQASSLGYFSWGWSIAGQAVFLLATNLKEVLLPIFVKFEYDENKLTKVALKIARLMTALLFIFCGAQALLAEIFIKELFPEKWTPAIFIIRWASIGLICQGILITNIAWLNACAKYRTILKVTTFQVLFVAIGTWLGLKWDGLRGAAIGCSLGNLGGAVISFISFGIKKVFSTIIGWILPFSLSFMIMFALMYISNGKKIIELLASLIYVPSIFFIWKLNEDEEMKMIIEKIKVIFLEIKNKQKILFFG